MLFLVLFVLKVSRFLRCFFACSWLRREGYLARVYERAAQLVSDFLDVPGGTIVPHDCTLGSYFDEIKFEARPYLYPLEVSLEAKTKDVEKQALKKVDTFRMAAQRLAYRSLTSRFCIALHCGLLC